MRPLHTPIRSVTTFYREIEELPHGDPSPFLASFAGQPRGFWGGRDRWMAWGGALARIRLEHGSEEDRFDRVRDIARRILGKMDAGDDARTDDDRPRFFGGFSFLRTGGQDAIWKSFPSAEFTLPRVVLTGDGGRVRLAVAHTGTGAAADSELEQLISRLSLRPERPPPAFHDPTWTPVGDPRGRERWEAAVGRVLRGVREGVLEKAVLARVLDVDFHRPVDPLSSLRFLRSENQRAHVYLFEPLPGQVFMGAAPEVLAQLWGDRFQATAVAGSIPRGASPEEDAQLSQRLLASEKDGNEHRLTVQEIVEVLSSRLDRLEVEKSPRVLSLARIQHLETAIRGQAVKGEDILSLVRGLHPTPAVCGRPRDAAQALIRAAEPFDRGWYAGPVGWFDSAGDGAFVPALRAAVGGAKRWRLFAGAGIVEGSDPEAEWEETGLKFEPALRALAAGSGQ